MADEFDHNTFDWGDDTPGIKLDDVAPDIAEIALAAALAVQEERYGWRYLKRSEVAEGAGRLFRSKFFMPKEARTWFEEQFPGYTFVWDGAVQHHDHPVAHLARELNEIAMVEGLIQKDEVWIDLFGDGRRDARYKRKCFNMYKKNTPKDYLRYQELGQYDVEYDLDKLCDPSSVYGKINNVTCTHAAYYLTIADIARIVNTSPGRKFHALVHRHKDVHGYLNAGEQEYWVTEDGMVRQVNVATGEAYTHPSLETLFHQFSAKTENGGVAWTAVASGGDSFLLQFVGCPNDICQTFVPLRFLKPETREVTTFRGVTVKKFLHWTWMQASFHDGQVTIQDMDLFSALRRYVAGKARTPRLQTELLAHARRLCNKNDIIAIHGGGASDIPVASMHQYCAVAFYVDQRQELDTALSFYKDNAAITTALNSYYEEGKTPRDYTLLTGAAAVTSHAFSEAATRVINHIRECNEISVRDYLKANLPGEDLAKLAIEFSPDSMVGVPWGGGW
jgi:hypothetical protein